MQQVLRGPEARCAIEIQRTDSEAILVTLDDDGSVALRSHPLEWSEVGQQYKNGRAFFTFDKLWHPLQRNASIGPEPYPVLEATRKFIRGCYWTPTAFKGGALIALAELLPCGDIHLFSRGGDFVGRFCSVEDCQMIATALRVEGAIVFASPEEFGRLPAVDQGMVLTILDAAREWPQKLNKDHLIEVFEMAKNASSKKGKTVAKAEAKQRKADGPVAKAREIFVKMKDKSTAEVIAACEKAGVNKGTATTQLGRWRKENGIEVKRGGARKKGETPAAATPTAAKKKKKKAATPGQHQPKTTAQDPGQKLDASKAPDPEKTQVRRPRKKTVAADSTAATPETASASAPADTTASAPTDGSTEQGTSSLATADEGAGA